MNTNAYTATHDEITGLPNEFLFLDRLSQTVSTLERGTSRFALLIISLNNYSSIINQYGQNVSNKLLLKITECLQKTLREPDTIARRNKNEFAILLPQIENSQNLFQLCRRIKNELPDSFQIDNNTIELDISMAEGIYPDNASNALELLKYVEIKINNSLP